MPEARPDEEPANRRDRRPELTPSETRGLALACLIAGVALVAWQTRGEWAIAVPAFLLVTVIGILGYGVYWLVIRGWRRSRISHEAVFASSAAAVALVTVTVTWRWGEWMGLRSILGSVTAASIVGLGIVLARLALRGPLPPDHDPTEPHQGQ